MLNTNKKSSGSFVFKYGALVSALLLSGCNDAQNKSESSKAMEQQVESKSASVQGSSPEEGQQSVTSEIKEEDKKSAEKASSESDEKDKTTEESDADEVHNENMTGVVIPAKEQATKESSQTESKGKTNKKSSKQADKGETKAAKGKEKEQAAINSSDKKKTKISDEDSIRSKIQEIQNLDKKDLVSWIDKNAAGNVIRSRTFGRRWSKLTKAEQNEFLTNWSKFIATNVESFQPLLKDYTIQDIKQLQVSDKLKQFTLKLEGTKESEPIEAKVVVTAKGLRVIDITVQDVSLVSILQTAVDDILNQKGDKIKNFQKFLKKGAPKQEKAKN